MTIDFASVTLAMAAMAYLFIFGLLVSRPLSTKADKALLLALLCNSVWLMVLTSQALSGEPGYEYRYSLEIIRNGGWIALFSVILGVSVRKIRKGATITISWFLLGLLILLATLGADAISRLLEAPELIPTALVPVGQVLIAIGGLVLVEQLWRNSDQNAMNHTKYLCIGAGAIFGYDFFLYADAILFSRISPALWEARGAINLLSSPLFGVALVARGRNRFDVRISRKMVFHTSVIVFTALYLMLMAIGGYYINALGGTWSKAVLITLLFFFTLLLIVAGSSHRIRARLLVFVTRHFFNYKYDYREEWLKVTRDLTTFDSDPDLSQSVVRIICSLVHSSAGALWLRDEHNHYAQQAAWNCQRLRHHQIDVTSELVDYMTQHEWIVNLREYREDPTLYNLMELPDPIEQYPKGWLVVPLYVREQLFGFVLVLKADMHVDLNWENYDLLKTVARQAGSYLAMLEAQDDLSEAKQFDAVNRTSAFLIHDLKTIIAQLSLLVKNAAKHRHNPQFIDDMIHTSEHALGKMNNLLQQIRNPVSRDTVVRVDIAALIAQAFEQVARRQPRPKLDGPTGSLYVEADREKLLAVFVHLLHNAQDATAKTGEIIVSLKQSPGWIVIFIQDTGSGMSDEFIKTQLFKPFESTKGLSGMGIGVYQSKEYVRKLGGAIDVTSELGVGSCFTIKLPAVEPE
ncbi:XrtA/PEP-CTERM system histidine kinase PrsK [Allohahella sp. A8]|uniref:XrtA/PEP-CTERM system histidine kinase PrsK n=1 Tax=Allohahella sp. A8 TaxID=3141461 RepID=UPI000C0A388D|nr:PEP-CTERM system histidine kinase PrsK [Hahellaceae bacterium]|tara:strand:- start:17988 stop:20051 length:2064 start_codon:yes stop_codon:yes gene_type:complete